MSKISSFFTIKNPEISIEKYLKRFIFPLVLIGLIIAADLISKRLIFENYPFKTSVPIIQDFFHIFCVRNTGGAFSFLDGARIFFLIVTPIALVVFVFMLLKSLNTSSVFLRITLAMVIAGAVGNYVDRIMFADGVRDFIEWRFFGLSIFGFDSFPATFNIADMALVFGVIMFAVYFLFIYQDPDDIKQRLRSKSNVPAEESVEEYLNRKNSDA